MATVEQLLKVIAEQQEQMKKQSERTGKIEELLLAMQQGTGGAPGAAQQTVPNLPDVHEFKPTEEKSRIVEWLERFKFALDCRTDCRGQS